MSDAMHRMTVLASAFARIASQFAELATEVSTVQPAAEQASPEAIEQAVVKRINDAQFLRRLSPFVMEEIDMDDLVERVADNVDADDFSRAMKDHIDVDEIVRSVTDEIDTDDIVREIAGNICAADIAEEIDMDELAERIDLTVLADHLIKQPSVLATLASEMVAHRYEEQLREQNRAEEVLKLRIEQLTETTLTQSARIRELLEQVVTLQKKGGTLMQQRQAEADDALSQLVDACIDAEADRTSSHIDPADMTGRQ